MAAGEGPEEIDGEDNPDEGDGDIDGPDELRVFLAAGEAERKGDGGGDDDQLPAPEMKLGKEIGSEARLDQALGGVIDAGKEHVADKGEDGGVRVKRTEPAKGDVAGAEVDLPEGELQRDDDADKHANYAPEDGGDHELADDAVIELDGDF